MLNYSTNKMNYNFTSLTFLSCMLLNFLRYFEQNMPAGLTEFLSNSSEFSRKFSKEMYGFFSYSIFDLRLIKYKNI